LLINEPMSNQNMDSMNEIRTYYINHVVTVTWTTSISCDS